MFLSFMISLILYDFLKKEAYVVGWNAFESVVIQELCQKWTWWHNLTNATRDRDGLVYFCQKGCDGAILLMRQDSVMAYSDFVKKAAMAQFWLTRQETVMA